MTKDTPFNDLPEQDQINIIKGAGAIAKKLQDKVIDTPKETWHKEFSKIMLDWIQSQWNIESSHQKGEPYTRMKFEAEASKVERRLEFFISKELAQAKADGAREVIEAVFQQIATMDGIKCEQERDIFRLLATLREDYKLKEKV